MLIDSALMRSRSGESTDLTPSGVGTLKHFFPCVETSGAILTDTIGSVVLTPTEISFDTYSVRPHEPLAGYGSVSAVPAIPVSSGNWVDLSTDSFCFLVVGVMDSSSDIQTSGSGDNGGTVLIGNDVGTNDIKPAVFAGMSTSNILIAGGLNTGVDAANHFTSRPAEAGGVADGVEGDVFMLDLQVERNNATKEVRYKRWNITKTTDENETINTAEDGATLLSAAPACTPDDYFSFRGIKLYGVALFQFSGDIPANYDTAAIWMRTQWEQGIKAISPLANAWT